MVKIQPKHFIEFLKDSLRVKILDIAENLGYESSSGASRIRSGEVPFTQTPDFVFERLFDPSYKLSLVRDLSENEVFDSFKGFLRNHGLEESVSDLMSIEDYREFMIAVLARANINYIRKGKDTETLPRENSVREGDAHFRNANYVEAIKCYKAAKPQFDGDMGFYKKLAYCYLRTGDYNASDANYREALLHCGENSKDRAELCTYLGTVCRKIKKREDAKDYFKEAERILEKFLHIDANDPDVATLYCKMGVFYLNEKDFDEVYSLYGKALSMCEENYKKHEDREDGRYLIGYYYALNNIGTYYNKIVTERSKSLPPLSEEERRDTLEKAAKYHEDAVNLLIGFLKPQSGSIDEILKIVKQKDKRAETCLQIAQSLNNWANDLMELGCLDDAWEKCDGAFKIREAKHGKDEMQGIAWSHFTFGMIHSKRGEYDKAFKCFEKSKNVRRDAHNSDHPYAAKALYQMGLMMAQLKDLPGACKYLKAAFDIQKRTLRDDDPELLDTKELLSRYDVR